MAEEPAAEPEAAVEEAPAEEPAAEEPVAEEPAAEPEAAVEEAPAEEPAAEARRSLPPRSPRPTSLRPRLLLRRLLRGACRPLRSPSRRRSASGCRAALRPQKTRPSRPVATGERKPIVRLPKPEHERGRRQERRGVVVSSAMDKTIVVKVDVITSHQRYKKVIRRSVKFHAHDEQNAANVGDVVRIVETRPLSKTKHWRLAEIVEVAK